MNNNICIKAYNKANNKTNNLTYSIDKIEQFIDYTISANIAYAAYIALNAAYAAKNAYNKTIKEIEKQIAIKNANLVIVKAKNASQNAFIFAQIEIMCLQIKKIQNDLNNIINTKKTIYAISDDDYSLNSSIERTITPPLTERSNINKIKFKNKFKQYFKCISQYCKSNILENDYI